MRLPGVIAAAIGILLLLVLAGCSEPNAWKPEDYSTSENKFQPICLDGVEYWVRAAHNKGYLAVRIDPETLQPRRCQKK